MTAHGWDTKGSIKMIEIVFFIAGCVISWLIALFYYRRSSKTIPEWAKGFVENLPTQQPTEDELLQLFQEHLDSGEIEVNPLLNRVACPKCGESAKNFKEEVYGDDSVTIVVFTCPICGWSEDAQA